MPNGKQSAIGLFAAAIAIRTARRYKYRFCRLANIPYRSLNRKGRALRERPRAIVKRDHQA
jgi:hypothetical protein